MSDDAARRGAGSTAASGSARPRWPSARNIAAAVVFVLTLGFIALGLFVGWGWGTGAFVCGYLFLRLRGRPARSRAGPGMAPTRTSTSPLGGACVLNVE